MKGFNIGSIILILLILFFKNKLFILSLMS